MTVTKIIPERETRKMNLAAYARVSTLKGVYASVWN